MRSEARRWAGLKVLLAGAIVASTVVVAAPAARAHTPHDDVFDVALSPTFSADGTMLAISREDLVRSTDAGMTWQRAVRGLDYRTQPRSVAFAGTSSSRAYAISGDAAFRSDDGGRAWRRILSPSSFDLRVLATSTQSPDVVAVAGSGAGFSITTDGGASWRAQATFGAPVTAVTFKKGSQQVLFAGDGNGVLHTTGNGGTAWQHYPLSGAGSVTSIALSPAFGTDGRALIGTSTGGIFLWNHSTKTATPVQSGPTDMRVTSIAYSANHGWDATVYASTWAGGLFVSRDRGTSWEASNDGLMWDTQTSLPGFLDRPNFGRVASALTDPVTRETTVVLAAFTGVYLSGDRGASWNSTETLSTSIVVGMSLSPQFGTDHKVAISTYVNGAFTSADGGASWSESNVGLAQSVLWSSAPDAYARMFNIAHAPPVGDRSWLFSSVVRHGPNPGGVLRSSNGGASWSLTTVPGFSEYTTGTRLPFVLPSPSFATDRTVLMADGSNGAVYRSTNEGGSFQQVGTIPRTVRCLRASPTFAFDQRIFACTSGGVYVSTDMGATWSPTRFLAISDLAVVIQDGVSETWLAATSSGLYRSTTLGMQWARVALPAPVSSSSQIVALAASPPSTSLGTVLVSVPGRGLLRSTDGGASFAAPSTALLDIDEQLDNFERPTASPLVFSPAFSTDQTVFGYSRQHLFRSLDGGVTWERVAFPRATHTGPLPVAPAPPSIIGVTGGAGSVAVSFTPGDDGGAPVLQFDGVCTSADGGATGTGQGTQSPVVVTGLTNGKTYTCRLTATNGIGTSAPSALSESVMPQGVPGTPTSPVAVAGDQQATVSWTTPVSDGGSPITAYVVQPFVGYYALPPVTFASTATTQTMTGLANGVTYRFKVTAVNALGPGAASKASNPVTPA